MGQAQSDLSQAGEVCTSCLPFWKSQKQEPKLLVELAPTTDGGTSIVVCPYCDGEPILNSAK